MKTSFRDDKAFIPVYQPAASRIRVLKGVVASVILHYIILNTFLYVGTLHSSFQFSDTAPKLEPIEVELVVELPIPPEEVRLPPVEPIQKDPPKGHKPEPGPELFQSAESMPPKEEAIQKIKADVLQQKKLVKLRPPVMDQNPKPLPPPPQLEPTKIVKMPTLALGVKGNDDSGAGQLYEIRQSAKYNSEEVITFGVEEEGSGNSTENGKAVFNAENVPLKQSERDFILSQILKYWRFNYSTPKGNNVAMYGNVTVMADGMLAPPFKGNQPWNPQEAMPKYAEAVRAGNDFKRRALESFYLALRMSQPLVLPPDTEGSWPRRISVSFRFQDLPKYEYR